MNTDLSKLFAKQLNNSKPTKKKPPKKKEIPEKKPPPSTNQDLDDQFNDTFDDDDDLDLGSLIGDSARAKLEQEISKAETMKYKAEQERLKLMKQSGEVMEFDKGDMLFFGFIEKGSIESLRVTKKLQAKIKNLCEENDPKGIMNIIDRELENVFVNIQEEQMETVENWRKNLK